MLNRRQFFSAAAAGAAFLARGQKAFAAKYDLIIRGGRVVDPSVRLDAVRDVAISGGRIAAIETAIAAHNAVITRKWTFSFKGDQLLCVICVGFTAYFKYFTLLGFRFYLFAFAGR